MLYLRRPAGRLGLRHLRKAHDDEAVADLALVRRRAVEAADMATARAGDGIRLEAVAVLDVRTENLLVGANADGLHVVRIERERTLVVEARLRNPDAVQLRFQKSESHEGK